MNLVNGELLDAEKCSAVLDDLPCRILDTLKKKRLSPQTVIDACDRLMSRLDEETILKTLDGLGVGGRPGKRYIQEARAMFCGEALRERLRIELGEDDDISRSYSPLFKEYSVTEKRMPLGVLLHIAAGNADGLPAFSVLEGLLTGNINILKLPAEEGGLSVWLLMELIKEEPALSEYVYVFDYSSRDIEQMERLVAAADAVVVWGGREAVLALRKLVPPHIRLIEWGHKISFAYVTEAGITDEGLAGLAENIVSTGQLLCSSLQGVFLDTQDKEKVYAFCRRFLPILEEALCQNPLKSGIGIRALTALKRYNEELEEIYKDSRLFKGKNSSLTAYPDRMLETSIQFGNAWVRPLPREELLETLRPYKNYLQTAGLLCAAEEREELSELLLKAGIVRLCRGETMSDAYCGMPHDGEYALRRYVKIGSVENKLKG